MTDGPRILIVDDDCMMAKTMADILNVKGFRADTAHSAAETLALASEHEFDCVLTDVKMPEMNGVDLFRALKKRKPDVPIVLMTAYAAGGRFRWS